MDEPTEPEVNVHHKIYQEATRLEYLRRTSSSEKGILQAKLCRRCKSGQVIRYENDQNIDVFCHSINKYVPSDIVECNRYTAVDDMNIFDMTTLALEIDAKRARDFGFTRGSGP